MSEETKAVDRDNDVPLDPIRVLSAILRRKPDGSVESVEVKTSSGHVTLDRAAVQHVKTKYKFLPISTDEIRYFEKDIQYQLQ